jgi:hypothetical protein
LKFIDKPLAIASAIFLLGSIVGSAVVILFPGFRDAFGVTLQVRMVFPVETAAKIGPYALFLLVFLNNSIPPVLAFIYPLVIAEIHWTPPLTERRRELLLSLFTHISSFLIGFFGIGAILGLVALTEGTDALTLLISEAKVHAPIEIFFVLICIAEPLRLAGSVKTESGKRLRGDLVLLWVALVGLLVSAAIEVFLVL